MKLPNNSEHDTLMLSQVKKRQSNNVNKKDVLKSEQRKSPGGETVESGKES